MQAVTASESQSMIVFCILKDAEDSVVVSTWAQGEYSRTVDRNQRHGHQNYTQVSIILV